ncbi:MAG: hypothetical protein NUV56_03275, partial [Candidatus Uhrbacteria bacterium]|nr:hypothetical protein [Candidatus Uhrbacteria bacterium]
VSIFDPTPVRVARRFLLWGLGIVKFVTAILLLIGGRNVVDCARNVASEVHQSWVRQHYK